MLCNFAVLYEINRTFKNVLFAPFLAQSPCSSALNYKFN